MSVLRNCIEPKNSQKPTLSAAVSATPPPIASRVYNLRSRSNAKPPVSPQTVQCSDVHDGGSQIIIGETESKIPGRNSGSAARTVPYTRKSTNIQESESESVASGEIPAAQAPPLAPKKEEVQPSSALKEFVFPPLPEEVAYVPLSPEEDILKDWEEYSSHISSSSKNSVEDLENELFVPETPPQS
ncbi:MAG TPA: hypothetical protein VMR37_04315 [Rhabdochlamydiaceae bacterium]|jgi:hypothetical protein|nr:hypothetical protein [Rhabdochlamydiaceae bacterium]